MKTTSHSMRPAREFWVNRGSEARMTVVFSKTRGKANGCIMISTGGEPGEGPAHAGPCRPESEFGVSPMYSGSISVGGCCENITLPAV